MGAMGSGGPPPPPSRQRGERVPLEPLLARLEDENADVRRAAARVLGERGERVPLEPLLARLEDKNADVRQRQRWKPWVSEASACR